MPELLDIVGQDAAVAQLQRGLAAGRMPHAYLFAGPAGVGRRTTATALARTLLCSQPTTRSNDGRLEELAGDFPLRQACGTCENCRLMTAGAHPDFHLVYKELAAYHDDPKVRDRKMQELGIDVIRSFLIGPAHRAASQGRGKVFLVLEAELMSAAAQSALLKTLEEPPRGVTIILLGSRPEQMLPTTLSRCCRVRFGPLPREFVIARLTESGVERKEAQFWAAFTDGAVGEAIRMAEAGLYEVKCGIVQRLASLPVGGDAAFGEHLVRTTDKLAGAAVKESRSDNGAELSKMLASRRAAGAVLRLIASAYRDALAAACGAATAPANADQMPHVQTLAERFEPGQLADILGQLSEYERLLWRNVNPKLVWDNVVITCASAAPLRL